MKGPQKGLLLVTVDPAPTLEEELNAWYDTEHLPERAAVPGVETALRYTSLGDGPRYLAAYDLESLDVLEGAAYRAVSGNNFSPWTRRLRALTHPVRLTARQVSPGDGLAGHSPRMLLLKFSGVAERDLDPMVEGLRGCFGPVRGVTRIRVFFGAEPSPDFALAMVEIAALGVPSFDPAPLGPLAAKLDLAASYRPYRG